MLQKGGVTEYDVLIGQLLLKDFTVIKIIMTAIITGMVGIYFLKAKGLVTLHPKPGSPASVVIGGLLFGVGFGLLGYCPGTVAGAVGQGYMDALLGGVVGIIIGAGFFARIYPAVKKYFIEPGKFKKLTFPEIFNIDTWKLVAIFSAIMIVILLLIEMGGY